MLIREASIADSRAIARVHVDAWRTTYDGMLPEEYLAGLSYDRSEERNREAFLMTNRPMWAYVAEDEEGTIVGFARGGRERDGHPEFTGELYAIYLRQSAQRSGAGRHLLLAIVRRLLAHGIETMLIWVLEQNPSRLFYEACGGEVVERKKVRIAGLDLDVIAYGWRDLRALVASGAWGERYRELVAGDNREGNR